MAKTPPRQTRDQRCENLTDTRLDLRQANTSHNKPYGMPLPQTAHVRRHVHTVQFVIIRDQNERVSQAIPRNVTYKVYG
eukprot:scaffold528993_cov181-Attheya_sp.AAC.1